MVKTLIQQTIVLTKTSMKARYRKSFAGLLWVVLNPVLLFWIQLFVFKNIIGLGFENYEFYLLSTYLPWQFINQTLTMGTPQLLSQGPLLKNIQLNPMLLTLTLSLDNFINFILAYLIIALSLNLTGIYSLFSVINLLPIFILIYVCVSALSFILSIVNVFFRDLQFILQFILMIFYFLTPIFYQPQMYPAKWQWLLKLNPFYLFIEPIISIVQNQTLLEVSIPLVKLVGMTILLLLLARLIWKKTKNEFYLNI